MTKSYRSCSTLIWFALQIFSKSCASANRVSIHMPDLFRLIEANSICDTNGNNLKSFETFSSVFPFDYLCVTTRETIKHFLLGKSLAFCMWFCLTHYEILSSCILTLLFYSGPITFPLFTFSPLFLFQNVSALSWRLFLYFLMQTFIFVVYHICFLQHWQNMLLLVFLMLFV